MMSIYIAFSLNQKQLTLQGDADLLPAFLSSLCGTNEAERVFGVTGRDDNGALDLLPANTAPIQNALPEVQHANAN